MTDLTEDRFWERYQPEGQIFYDVIVSLPEKLEILQALEDSKSLKLLQKVHEGYILEITRLKAVNKELYDFGIMNADAVTKLMVENEELKETNIKLRKECPKCDGNLWVDEMNHVILCDKNVKGHVFIWDNELKLKQLEVDGLASMLLSVQQDCGNLQQELNQLKQRLEDELNKKIKLRDGGLQDLVLFSEIKLLESIREGKI